MTAGEGGPATIATVTNRQLAQIHVAVRRQAKLRQSDVAREAGVGLRAVRLIEAGGLDEVRVRDVRASFAALGARIVLTASYRGAGLPRILDELHAVITKAVLEILRQDSWLVKVEVSFAVGRESGSIDVLAWKADERALLVVEIKSELPGVDPLLRPLDVKVRLASGIARAQFGWQPLSVSRLVVLPEDRTARRLVDAHASVIRSVLPARSREVRRWLHQPAGTMAGLWFLTIAPLATGTRNPSSVRRVKRPKSRSALRDSSTPDDALKRFDRHKVR